MGRIKNPPLWENNFFKYFTISRKIIAPEAMIVNRQGPVPTPARFGPKG
jgi:hypothetical protein